MTMIADMLRALALATLMAISTTSVGATIFFDDFESGGLSTTRWLTGSGGVVDTDPLQFDGALRFNRVWRAGDLLSTIISGTTGSYVLSFDYLGTCGHQDCGGFIGHEPGDVWDAGSQPSYPTTLFPGFLVDDGTWHHYTVGFTTPNSIRLQLEDFVDSGGNSGDAWFDNVAVTDGAGSGVAPEPGTLGLLALGLAGVGSFAQRKAIAAKQRMSATPSEPLERSTLAFGV